MSILAENTQPESQEQNSDSVAPEETSQENQAFLYPNMQNMQAAAAMAASAAGANGAAPGGAYPYYYPGADPSTLNDPNAAAAAATAAAAAMAASAAAYGIPSMNAARRSRHAIEVGPYFKPTKQTASIYSMDRTRTYTARLLPRIDKGFFLSENDWTCYRRNYFQLTCSFTCTDSTGLKVETPCLVDVEGRGLRTVTEFIVNVSARSNNGTREIDLVQHTAKRDKGPQTLPEPKRCDPQDLTPNYGMRPDSEAFHSITFERIQFKSATANNGKRRAAQQYHSLVVELLAKCDDGYMARVASTESAPLVVRGRAPGHYHAMAAKENAENPEQMGHFPYYPAQGGDGSHYYPMNQMMQSGYYYYPYWANVANASAAAAAALGEVETETPAESTEAPEDVPQSETFESKDDPMEGEEPKKKRGRPKKEFVSSGRRAFLFEKTPALLISKRIEPTEMTSGSHLVSLVFCNCATQLGIVYIDASDESNLWKKGLVLVSMERLRFSY